MAVAINRVSEFFLLRDLEEHARAIPAERRLVVKRAHLLARQKRRAAEVLWGAHAHAEALGLLREAVAIAREADDAGPASVTTSVHALESELGPGHEAQYRALHDELEASFARQLGAALGPRGIARLRANRIALAGTLLIAGAIVLFAALRRQGTLSAAASASYSATHEARNAIDGNAKTEWLLPDHATGYLDVQVAPARKVKSVRVVNARNLPYADRGTKDFELELWLGGQVVKKQVDTFPALNGEPGFRDLEVNTRVDRLRVNVLSHHGSGAGVAEIEVH